MNVVGGSTVQYLVVDGTTGADHIVVTGTAIPGLGAAINHTGLLSVTLDGKGGDDALDVPGDSAPTIIDGGNGDLTVNVAALSDDLTVNTGAGQRTVTRAAGGLGAAVTVVGDGRDRVNVNGTAGTGTLTGTTLTGLGTGGLTYAGRAALNLGLTGNANALAVTNTAAGTATTVAGPATRSTFRPPSAPCC